MFVLDFRKSSPFLSWKHILIFKSKQLFWKTVVGSLWAQCFFFLIHVLPLVFLFVFWVCFVPFLIDEALFWFLLYCTLAKIWAFLGTLLMEKAPLEGILFSLRAQEFGWPFLYMRPFSLCNRCASFSFQGSFTKIELQNNTLASLIILWQLYSLASSSLVRIFVTNSPLLSK